MAATDAPTVRALLAHSDLRLTPALPEDALTPGAWDRPIRWVHNSDLLDPTPSLSDGLVLLTTGTQFAEGADSAEFDAYVSRLRERGVVALGYGTEVARAGIPPLLVAACAVERMPLFEVPYRTPFIAVAQANAEAIAAEAFARRNWALSAQRAIALAALRPDGLTATLAELARQLDAWVGLFDPAGTLTGEHPAGTLDDDTASALHTEVGRVLRRGARAGSALTLGTTPFTLQTLGRGGHLRGVIAIAAGELDREGRGVVTSVIAMAGLALEQNEGLSRSRALLRTGVLQSLLSGDPALAHRIAREMWGGLPPSPVLVATTDPGSATAAMTEWLELHLDERPGRLFFAQRGEDPTDGLVIVVSADAAEALNDVARTFETRIGISKPAEYAAFVPAVQQADVALRRGTGRLSRFDQLATSGVLTALDSLAGRALARAVLEPLRAHDESEAAALVDTVRTWLEHDARFDAAAEALGVHRHTVRARVAVAQRLLGVDLSTFRGRAELWAALQVEDPDGSSSSRRGSARDALDPHR
jgi:purine catabolism regulator